MDRKITILAAASLDALENNGAEVEYRHCVTVAEAKKRARYLLTKEYQDISESSERLAYSRVVVNGECVADYFVGE